MKHNEIDFTLKNFYNIFDKKNIIKSSKCLDENHACIICDDFNFFLNNQKQTSNSTVSEQFKIFSIEEINSNIDLIDKYSNAWNSIMNNINSNSKLIEEELNLINEYIKVSQKDCLLL